MDSKAKELQQIRNICVASKTSENFYFFSSKENDLYNDYVSINGRLLTNRLFTILFLKSIFKNYGISDDTWTSIENEIKELQCKFDLEQTTKFQFLYAELLTSIRKKYVELTSENATEIKNFLKGVMEKFVDARTNPLEVRVM